MNDIVQFIRDSPKRLAQFKSVADSVGVPDANLRPLCPTRWTLRLRSLQSVKKSFKPLRAQLNLMATEMKNDRIIRAKVAGFSNEMNSFKFIFWLTVCIELFETTTSLSKILQSSSISAGEGRKAAQLTLDVLCSYGQEHHFYEIWMTVKGHQATLEISDPSLPRLIKRPLRYEDGSESYEHQTVEKYFRVLHWKVLDSIIVSMTSRFHCKGHQITETIEKVIFDGFASKTVDKIALTELSLHFGDDISTSRLRSELCVLANIP